MIVKTKLAEQAEQFEIDGKCYVGRRVLHGCDWDIRSQAFPTKVLFQLDCDAGLVFVDPAILQPYQRPERKEEAGT